MTPNSPARRGDYGFDAPYAPAALGFAGIALLGLGGSRLLATHVQNGPGAVAPTLGGLWLLLNALTFVHTTRRGKFAVWSELLDSLRLRGDERVLDIGCGRGAVLLMAARRLPHGVAVGVDLWSTTDQSGNAERVTRRNAELEGVSERVELYTADMRQLPFEDDSFDVVVSSLAIHNVRGAPDRAKALHEAARVLKPGGRLLIADIRHARVYARELASCGLTVTESRSLGFRFWYALGPWAAARMVAAVKPVAAAVA